MFLCGVILFFSCFFCPEVISGDTSNHNTENIVKILHVENNQEIKKTIQGCVTHLSKNHYDRYQIKNYIFPTANYMDLFKQYEENIEEKDIFTINQYTQDHYEIAFCIYHHLVLFPPQNLQPQKKEKTKNNSKKKEQLSNKPESYFQELDKVVKENRNIDKGKLQTNNKGKKLAFVQPFFKTFCLSTLLGITGYGIYHLLRTAKKQKNIFFELLRTPVKQQQVEHKGVTHDNQTVSRTKQDDCITFKQNDTSLACMVASEPKKNITFASYKNDSSVMAQILGTSFSLTLIFMFATFLTPKKTQSKQANTIHEPNTNIIRKTLRIFVAGIALFSTTYFLYYQCT